MAERVPTEELKLADDWTVGDLQSVNDCDDALVLLTREIHNIDLQIAVDERVATATSVPTDAEWLARARSARAVKNAIRGIVQRKQSEFARAAKIAARETWRSRFIDRFKAKYPMQYAEILKQAGTMEEAR